MKKKGVIINVEEISGSGIGIYFEFPEDSCQQIGWIPKGKLVFVEQMRKTYICMAIWRR